MRFLRIGCPLVLAATVACGSDWAAHDTSPAFTVRTPPGWDVRSQDDGRILLESPAGERIVLWPFFVRRRLDTGGAAALLQRFGALLDAQASWEGPQALAPNVARMTGRAGDRVALAGIVHQSGATGSSGYVYCIAAHEARLRRNEAAYAEILRSLRLRGGGGDPAPGGEPARPAMQHVRYTDPSEQAFTLEVPSGWSMSGGLVRRAAVDVTSSMNLASPDGEIQIFVGDAGVPAYTLPAPMLTMTGFTEGSWYSPGYGVNLMVMSYRPGVAFAREYAGWRFAQTCPGLEFGSARDRPDAAQKINDIYRQYGSPLLQSRLTIGEVRFRCAASGRAGYVLAGTTLTESAAYGMGLWQAEHLYGYTAPERRAGEAQAVLEHMLASLRLNPAWVRMQHNLAGQVSAIVTDTNNYISSVISQSYADRQASQDEVARRRANAILGLEDVRDPETGQAYKVESGATYYWVDALGNIAGTELATNPDALRFHEMVRLP